MKVLDGTEPAAVWAQVATLYSAFAIEEGARQGDLDLKPSAFQTAAAKRNSGYNLALLTSLPLRAATATLAHSHHSAGFLAWRNTARGIEILDLYVQPQARRHGLASQAINRLVGKGGACVDVHRSNQRAKAFYRTLGFREFHGVLLYPPARQYPSFHDQYYDVESDRWLPACWPTPICNKQHLDQALAAGAQRLWVSTPLYLDAVHDLGHLPYHSFAVHFEK